jgi:hypothetical protein
LNKSKTNPWKELQTSAKPCTDYATSDGIPEAHSVDFAKKRVAGYFAFFRNPKRKRGTIMDSLADASGYDPKAPDYSP